MTLAREHNWTPEQIDALDPEFVTELLMAHTARNDHELLTQKPGKDDKELRAAQAKRRAELAKWRRGLS